MAATQLIPTRDFHEMQSHRRARDLYAEIDQVKSSIRRFAAAGDVGKVRELRRVLKTLERQQEEESQTQLRLHQEAVERRERRRPGPGEVARLAKERKNLLAQAEKKEKAKARLLARIADDGAEALDEQAEQVDDDLRLIQSSIAGIDRRLEEIEDWQQEQQRARELRASEARRKSWAAQHARRQKVLAKIAGEAVAKMHSHMQFYFEEEVSEKVEIQTGDSLVVMLTFEGKRRKHAD